MSVAARITIALGGSGLSTSSAADEGGGGGMEQVITATTLPIPSPPSLYPAALRVTVADITPL